jgi:hypothetical protein
MYAIAAPTRLPQWQQGPDRYHTQALIAALPLRLSWREFEPLLLAVPAAGESLPASGTTEYRVSVPTGSYLYAYSTWSAASEGANVQIVDLGTRARCSSQPVFTGVMGKGSWPVSAQPTDASGVSLAIDGVQCLLPKPRLILEPGLLSVQVRNRAATAQQVQIVLWIAARRQA